MDTLIGGRYRLDAELARGAIGVVWRGYDTVAGVPVAVKVLRPEVTGPGRHAASDTASRTGRAEWPGQLAAFLGEAEILAELDHPSVVKVRDLVPVRSGYALVLELVRGVDLRRRLLADGPLA